MIIFGVTHSNILLESVAPKPGEGIWWHQQRWRRKSPTSIPRHSSPLSGEGRKAVVFSKKHRIFAQGDAAEALFYIQEGKVRLTVVSDAGKEATIGILSDGNFFGEGCLAGQPLRMASATALIDCDLLRIEKKAMMEALHREHALSDLFVAYLLGRNIWVPAQIGQSGVPRGLALP
jgi:CRP-like cAMP-binding protein